MFCRDTFILGFVLVICCSAAIDVAAIVIIAAFIGVANTFIAIIVTSFDIAIIAAAIIVARVVSSFLVALASFRDAVVCLLVRLVAVAFCLLVGLVAFACVRDVLVVWRACLVCWRFWRVVSCCLGTAASIASAVFAVCIIYCTLFERFVVVHLSVLCGEVPSF